MTTTTMRFGPEWMRKQPAPAKPLATSPPNGAGGQPNGTPVPPGAASYSALVTPHAPPLQGKRDIAHPFKYSRDEMLQFYKDIGGPSELPIEVERWEGVVREEASEPVCLADLTDTERKLYATSLNSEMRRRQSTDYMAQGDRSKGGLTNTGLGLMGRRRRGDSNGTDHPPLSLPRKTSWSGTPGSTASPSVVSPRSRVGSGNGFDGVLTGSDTAWGGGKRRIPSGLPISGRVDEEPPEDHNLDTEKVEQDSSRNKEGTQKQTKSRNPEPSSLANAASSAGPDISDTTASMSNLNINTDVGTVQSTEQPVNLGTESTDLSKVEWSYVDPAGNIQGPFPGDIMQQWHERGYFDDNLRMKRTTIDSIFMPLSEIKRRALGERVFLSPLSSIAPPPGLGHLAPGLNPLLQRTGLVDSIRQPSPQQYVRGNISDSLMNVGSTATGSASPSSSFGGNAGRGPISPDPLAVGSRLQRLASDVHLNGRISSAGSYSSDGSPALAQAARNVFNETLQPNRSSSLDTHSNLPWQYPQQGGTQVWNGSPDVSQFAQQGRHEQFIGSSFGHPSFVPEPSSYAMSSEMAPVDPFLSSSVPTNRLYGQTEQLDFMNHDIRGFQQGVNGVPVHFDGIPQQQLPQSLAGNFEQLLNQPIASPNGEHLQHQSQTMQAPPLSPWGVPQAREPSRPSPFDADMPTSSNTFVVPLPQAPKWNKPEEEASAPIQTPWGTQTGNQQGQVQFTEEPQSLTTANLTQHNEGQSSVSLQVPRAPGAASSAQVTVNTTEATETTTTTSLPSASVSSPMKEPVSTPATSTKRKSTSTAANTGIDKASPATSTGASAPRAPWASGDETKTKQPPPPKNLREIQEEERKRQEARKAAEKDRERSTRAPSGTSSSEEVHFTTSWGLPTSQVGARNNSGSIPVSKEAQATSPATSSTPVWTNAAKPPAKTMKEIQEEEERRKQAMKERETAASAAKRAVNGPAVKTPSASTQPSGGAWTTVGASGKATAPASVIAARPSSIAQVSNPITASARPPALGNSSRSQSTSQVVKTAPSTSKADDEPVAPSPEFMKWMREKLRGLNSAVQFEEIAQMLLSFPLESLKEESTVDIIAETVYGASTTLSGRDFAKDFVKKRREDLTRGGKEAAAANGKPPSLADVVKSQPKPASQNEFGQFKVVKKKGKRSKDNS